MSQQTFGLEKPDGSFTFFAQSPSKRLGLWLKNNWTLVSPIGISDIKWGQWFNGYGDIALKCVEASTRSMIANLGGSEELDTTIIDIHIFYRSLQQGEEVTPDNLTKMREYIRGALAAGKLAFYPSYGVIQYFESARTLQEDLDNTVSKLHHLIMSVRWNYTYAISGTTAEMIGFTEQGYTGTGYV